MSPRPPARLAPRLLGGIAIVLGCASSGPPPSPKPRPRPAKSSSPAPTPQPTATARGSEHRGSPATDAARPSQDPRQSSPRQDSPSGPAEPAAVAGITEAHNRARKERGVPPLTWSPQLAAVAEEWAQRLAAKGCNLQHRSDARFGENLYAIYGTSATAQEVVDSWVSEVANYDYKKNRCKGICGHYTQVVWRSSRSLGCAAARCSEGEVWVCNYDPPGNFVGEQPY